ncbi:sensor histidine kinase [Actinoalloteichus hymeniacidonis]|uniref:histidine kinase n=1 Tax=Actinoalloteichus hymeniacidonis TaxID=340345 RepID=A0AAC9HQ66_9PSEU|nr:HAMP domain-containing sensor histidine kinase [Actinoalloteichus hymeniacidonis]AOS62555.1 signal transduction histidine kinase [Actinoalloteichus hymeniacidonis]MBB5909414.1 signal transduction histidine kinase [Actinoalloteichus hymeniacidonis]
MRRRLAILVATTTSLVLVAFLVPLALLIRSFAEDRAVHAATVEAQSLIWMVANTDTAELQRGLRTQGLAEQPVSIYLPDGTVVGEQTPPTRAVELAMRGQSLAAETPEGREILFATVDADGQTAVIRTLVTTEAMSGGVVRSWLILALLGVVLMAVSVLVSDRLAHSLVRPTRRLADVSHRLAGGELDARATPEGPEELRDVAGGLNHLAGRIKELLREERETVADLSHRLRTPLTSMKLEAESLSDPADARRIGASVAELERAVSEIIGDARRRAVETGAHAVPVLCDAAAVVRDRVQFWSVLAEDTERPVELDLALGPVLVALPESDLAACVDALLGNIFAHTPDGSAFAVRLLAWPTGGARLVVADAGPGFAGLIDGHTGPLRRGASGAGSTGLGLDIARRTATASGGTVRLGASEWGGAQITLDLGAPKELSPGQNG